MKFISNISIHGGLSVPFLTNLFSNICDIEVTDDVTGGIRQGDSASNHEQFW